MKPNIKSRTVFLGDNIDFLRGINSACVDLIYADPPFNKKKQFTAPIGSEAEGASFSDYFGAEDIKDEWVEELRQENHELHSLLIGVNAMGNSYNYCYLVYMAIRLIECHRVLKSTGSFYLHCDPTMSHYLKLLLDCIFGGKQFQNEFIWYYGGGGAGKNRWGWKHDVLLFFTKSANWTFNMDAVRVPHKWSQGQLRADGSQRSLEKGKIADDVFVRHGVMPWSKERTGYPTQKPLALLERIISASSNPGDFVLDPFCGCVTTCIAAERLERNWVGIDVAREAWKQIEQRLEKDVPSDLLRGEANFSRTPPQRGKQDARAKKYVYVISNPAYPGIYKVGVATNAEARLASYQTADPKRRYQLEFKILTAEYKTLEPHIHRKFDGDHEWVPGKLADIIAAMKTYQAPA